MAYKVTRLLWMQENGLDKFSTIVSEVSSFVGNPVYQNEMKLSLQLFRIKNLDEGVWLKFPARRVNRFFFSENFAFCSLEKNAKFYFFCEILLKSVSRKKKFENFAIFLAQLVVASITLVVFEKFHENNFREIRTKMFAYFRKSFRSLETQVLTWKIIF